LLTIIRTSLLELQKAVKGFIVMNADLEQLGRSLIIGVIPLMWAGKSYPSRKPLASYIADLVDRVDFLRDWLDNGMPIIFWLSSFFFTQSFLTGAKQNYARRHKVAIDMVDFEFRLRDHDPVSNSPPPPQKKTKNKKLKP
jgi:dynein heavy chain